MKLQRPKGPFLGTAPVWLETQPLYPRELESDAIEQIYPPPHQIGND